MKKILLALFVACVLCLAACGMVDGPGMENTDPIVSSDVSEETPVSSSETTIETTSEAPVTIESTTEAATEVTTEATTEVTTETTTEVTTVSTEPEPVETPATILERICSENETIVLSYYDIDGGETEAFEVDADEFLGQCSNFMISAVWSEFAYFPDIKNLFPELYRVTVSSPDGVEKLVVSLFNNGGNGTEYILYSDGAEIRNWENPDKPSVFDFFHNFRRVYYYFEMNNADSSVDGWYGPEGACEYFAKTAYFESRKNLSAGSDYRFNDFELINFEVTGVNSDGTAVSGSMTYAFKPDNWESPFIMVGNTRVGTEEYSGYLIESRSFILTLEDDYRWHCTGIGTGGYKVQ